MKKIGNIRISRHNVYCNAVAVIGVSIIIAGLLFGCGKGKDYQKYKALKKSAEKAAEEKDYETAIEKYEEALEIKPSSKIRKMLGELKELKRKKKAEELEKKRRKEEYEAKLNAAKNLAENAKTVEDWDKVIAAYRVAGEYTEDGTEIAKYIQGAEKKKAAIYRTRYENAIKQGNQHLANGNWQKAKDAFKEAQQVKGYSDDKEAIRGIARAEKLRKKQVYEKLLAEARAAYKKTTGQPLWKQVPHWEKVKKICEDALKTGHTDTTEAQKLLAESKIRLIDPTKFKHLKTLKGHSEAISSIAFSPDGRLIASGSYDKTVRIWDVKKGRLFKNLTKHTGFVTCVVFSSGGQSLISSGGRPDNTIRLWDIKKGKVLKTLSGHTKHIGALVCTPDGSIIASGSCDKTVRLWDVKSGKTLKTFTGYKDYISSLAFRPDGQLLAIGHGDKTIHLLDVQRGKTLKILAEHTMDATALAFSPDGSALFSTSLDGTSCLWDSKSGKVRKAFIGHSGTVWSVAVNPDGRILATGGGLNDRAVRLWDIRSGKCRKVLCHSCYVQP